MDNESICVPYLLSNIRCQRGWGSHILHTKPICGGTSNIPKFAWAANVPKLCYYLYAEKHKCYILLYCGHVLTQCEMWLYMTGVIC